MKSGHHAKLAALSLALLHSSLPADPATALVRHAPTLNGTVDGSLQQMAAESVTLNGGAIITGDLLVPGTPTLRLNGSPDFGGVLSGTGAISPSSHTVVLNGKARLRYLRTRTDAIVMPVVAAPPAPLGSRSVSLNSAGQSAGDFATLRDLTLNGNVGPIAVPPGVYGDFTANGGSSFTLGVAGATTTAVYTFQRLTLNGKGLLNVVGPVVITVANSITLNSSPVGNAQHPEWLTLKCAGDGPTLNAQVTLFGYVVAPAGTVIINGQSSLVGGVVADRLVVNSNGALQLLVPPAANRPPEVAIIAPAAGARYTAPATFTLAATASDPDGTVVKVAFYQGTVKLGECATTPFQFTVSNLAAGTYAFTARAFDNTGAATDSSAISVIVGVNQPPTVTLTSPAAGTAFTAPATLTLAATAGDADGTVTKVEFFQGTNKLGERLAPPYQWTATGLVAGSYTFTARATDNGNAFTNSAPIAVTVVAPPNQPPAVDLTAPVNGTTFTAPATIHLTANATDPDGTITQVEFFQGSLNLGAATSAPYQFAVGNLPVGSYTFKARATDNLGTTADSLPVTIGVLGGNEPPTIALTSPPASAIFNVPASILLAANATDSDGTIARVEFFQGTSKLGESAQAPFTFTWSGMLPGSYALSAKAYDNQGATTLSLAVPVMVQAALPYMTDFEAAEGYTLGSLAGQGGWSASGSANITANSYASGAWSVALSPAANGSQLMRTFPSYTGQAIVFADCFVRPTAGITPETASAVQAGAAKVALVRNGTQGELLVYDGDGDGGGVWHATGCRLDLGTDGLTISWVRLSWREDFAAKKWDLFANGKLVAIDAGFASNTTELFATFSISSPPTAATLFDSLYVGFDNPLFADADKDGMDDVWEAANGLNPAVNDRARDPDGDGNPAIVEYRAGTSPTDFFNGATPMLEALNGGKPDASDALAMVVRHPDGTPWANAPVSFRITAGDRLISATQGGPNYSESVQTRADANGVAKAYLEPL